MVYCKLAQISFRFLLIKSGSFFKFLSIKYKTEVFNPLKLKSKGPTLGFGKGKAFELPSFEYLSINGPPG